MKPVIGIISTIDYDKDNDKQYITKYEIVQWILECGAIPISILPTKNFNDLKKILIKCDGIIKPGGHCNYKYQKLIYKYTLEKDIPYLGICAGMQLMIEAIEKKPLLIKNKNMKQHKNKNLYSHEIEINKKSKLYNIIGKEKIIVNSRHNYHISNTSKFFISAKSFDNQIEAIEYKNKKFNIGVQWHPELYNFDNIISKKIFNSFIQSSKKIKNQKDQEILKKYNNNDS